MVDLPPELWLHIIFFLTPLEVEGLYSVNRTFFEVAMEKKYRHVSVIRSEIQSSQKLESLKNPDVALRVRSLDIALHLFRYEFLLDPLKCNRLHKHHNQKPLGSCSKIDAHAATSSLMLSRMPGTLLGTFQLLRNIEKVCLRWEVVEDHPTEYLDDIWRSIAQNLLDLTIISTCTKFEELIPSSTINFPRLICLHISVKQQSYRPNSDLCDDTQLALASFVNSFRSTLQYLSIHCIPKSDLQLVYKNLVHFKHIISININVISPKLSDEEPSYSLLFVKGHSDTLRHLTMTVTRLQSTNSLLVYRGDPNFHRLLLPKLQTLSVTAEIVTGVMYRLRILLTDVRPTLRSFEIVGPISPGEAEEILPIFNHPSTDSVLTKLSVSIFRLHLSFLLKLRNWLPGLKILKLQIMKLGDGTDFGMLPGKFFPLYLPPHEDAHVFVNEVAACQELRSWEISDILIQRHSCCDLLTLWNLMHFFATCIPTVSSFDELGHMDIPENPNPTPTQVEGERCSGEGVKCTYGMDGVNSTCSSTDSSLRTLRLDAKCHQ